VGNNHILPMQDSFQICLHNFYSMVLIKMYLLTQKLPSLSPTTYAMNATDQLIIPSARIACWDAT
jgi:hypothetical protein